MKKEASKKKKLWLWLGIGLGALVVVAGIVLAMVFGGLFGDDGPKGGRPDLYWNFDRQTYLEGSITGLSTREPGEDGIYRITFAYNGAQVELPIVDKQLVNVIDTMDVMGLVFDADDVVVDVIPVEEIAIPVALSVYVQQVTDDAIIANSSIAMNGMRYNIAISDLLEVYDVSNTAETIGETIDPTELLPMDTIWVYANDLEEPTHVYLTNHPKQSKVYWRTRQEWDSTKRGTARIMGEDGAYPVEFCCEGEIVTLRCKDEAIMANIDSKSPHSCHFGFIFDEEGYIIDIINSGVGIRATVAAERMEVTEVNGNTFSAQQMIPSDNGLTYTGTLPEDCPIYDASSVAIRNKCQGQRIDSLQVGDRVCVWTDSMGTPVLVYVANRMIDVPLYWSVTRSYNSAEKVTRREPDQYGYYNYEVVKVGTTGKTTVKTADKELANYMDSLADRVLGLDLDGNIVKQCYATDDTIGWSSVRSGYTTSVQGNIQTVVGFTTVDKPVTTIGNVNMKVYDMTDKDVPIGTETKLRVGDYTMCTRNVALEGMHVFIMRREVGGDCVYYNLNRKYDSTTKETTRKPDADGYYVFDLAHNGKVVQVKTKDRELANKIEASPVGDMIVVLRVENGIAYEIYDTQAAFGQVLRSGTRVKSVNGDGTFTVVGSSKTETTIKMADDCVIYNVSDNYVDFQGERTYSIQVGDMVSTLADYKSEAKLIYVRRRCVDKMYVNSERLYDTGLGGTIREPDANGWYWFHLSEEGTMKWFKTDDYDMAAAVDLYQTPFGLRVEGDVIKAVVGPAYVRPNHVVGDAFWDVVAINGRNVTIKLNKPGYAESGTTKTMYIGSNTKVYDISPTAENFGAPAELKVGDQIRNYKDFYGNVNYVYIEYHPSRVKGEFGYCEHCKKEVQWFPWSGESIPGADAHYYLAASGTDTRQGGVGKENLDYEVVLDLNGKTWEVTSVRALLVHQGDTLSVIDSVGGGRISGSGVKTGGGGTVRVSTGGTFNLYSGTLDFLNKEDYEISAGGTVRVNNDCVFNMYGGTVTGGIVDSEKANVQGGNIYLYDATFNMYGGVVEGGQAIRSNGLAAQGANIFAGGGAVINLYGGTIRDGYTNQNGGNIFYTKSTLNMYGGTIEGGKADSNGGNVYSQFESVSTFAGGTIKDGTATGLGHNVYVSQEVAELYFTGTNIAGDVYPRGAKIMSVSGTPKITNGKDCGLLIPSNVKLTVGALKDGADVAVTATGAFSIANAKAQQYVDNGYVSSTTPKTAVVVYDDVMYVETDMSGQNAIHTVAEQMTADGVFDAGGDVTATCPVCEEEVTWKELPTELTANYPVTEAGHYYLSGNVSGTGYLSFSAKCCLHLNGHNITGSGRAISVGDAGALSIMGEGTVTGSGEFTPSSNRYRGAVDATGAVALYGGTYTSSNAGPIIVARNYTGNNLISVCDGATITRTGNAGYGIVIFDTGDLDVYGGEISGCTNNVYLAGRDKDGRITTVNVYGGTISGGSEANIKSTGMNAEVNISGGNITDGEVFISADNAGGVKISGAPVISKLNLTSGAIVKLADLRSGADIAVLANGAFTEANTNAQSYLDAQYVKSAVQNAIISVENDVMVMEREMQYCSHCDKNVVWDEWTGSGESGHYFLTGDFSSQAAKINVAVGADVVLDLKGHTYTTTGINTFQVAGTLSIMDSEGTGKLVASGNTGTPGAVAIVGGTDATLNLYSGTLVLPATHAEHTTGQLVDITTGGTFNVYGGEITTEAALTGGLVSVADTFNMEGGKISGEVTVTANALNVTLANDAKITKLAVDMGKLVDVSGLTEGAAIGVSADGIFTKTLTDAESYLAYFVKVLPDDEYSVVDDAIHMVTVTEQDRRNAIHTAAEQMTTDGVFDAGGQITAMCPVCGEEVVWNELAANTTSSALAMNVAGHYYVSGDLDNGAHYSVTANCCIHLNGNDITSPYRAFTVNSPAVVNFMGEGTVSGAFTQTPSTNTYRGTIDVTGSANFYGGTYTSTASAAAIVARGSAKPNAVNIYDGTIVTRPADNAGMCIGVYGSGDCNVYGGEIYGGTNNIQVAGSKTSGQFATLSVYGGTITGGTNAVGGNIRAIGPNVGVNIYSGTITGGEVNIADNVSEVSISGDPTVSELNLPVGKLINVGTMKTGAEVRVEGEGVFTGTLTNAEEYLKYFKAAADGYEIAVEGSGLTIRISDMAIKNAIHTAAEQMTADSVFAAGGQITAECPVCGTEVVWTELNTLAENRDIAAGHYYLSDDITCDDYFSFSGNSCLHLNGCDITSSAKALQVNAPDANTAYVLNVMGEGVVTGAGAPNSVINRGGALDLAGCANLYGGTYKCSNVMPIVSGRGYANKCFLNIYEGAQIIGDANHDAPSIVVRSCNIGMYGGRIADGKGGNIYASGGYCTMNLYGGVIENGGVNVGANIYAETGNVVVNLNGTEITDGDVFIASDVKQVTASGKPVVSNLNLTSGKKLILGTLEEGAQIYVTAADGAFTEISATASSCVDYFKAVQAGKCVKAIDNALAIADAS